jgi:hypothetical protein
VRLTFNRENKEELQGILATIKRSTVFYPCLERDFSNIAYLIRYYDDITF